MVPEPPILLDAPLLVVDTETTGFPGQPWCRCVEIGAVLLEEHGAVMATWSSLLRPDVLDERADRALSVNRLTRSQLLAAPPTPEVVERFQTWLDRWGRPGTTSYNVAFDRKIIEALGVELPWAPCIMRTAARWFKGRGHAGGGKYPKLAECLSEMGIPQDPDGAHRALYDAHCAAQVALYLLRQGEDF